MIYTEATMKDIGYTINHVKLPCDGCLVLEIDKARKICATSYKCINFRHAIADGHGIGFGPLKAILRETEAIIKATERILTMHS
jgi:hypothetical protein